MVVVAPFSVVMASGVVDEMHQMGRTASTEDIGRDAIGGLIAVLLTRAIAVITNHVFHKRWVQSGHLFFSVAMLMQAGFVAGVVSMCIAAGSTNEYSLDALTTPDVQRSLVHEPEALLAAVPFLAIASWLARGKCKSLYAQKKLIIAPTACTGVVFAIPVAVFGLGVIPDVQAVWVGTWLLAAGAWLFGAWLHI